LDGTKSGYLVVNLQPIYTSTEVYIYREWKAYIQTPVAPHVHTITTPANVAGAVAAKVGLGNCQLLLLRVSCAHGGRHTSNTPLPGAYTAAASYDATSRRWRSTPPTSSSPEPPRHHAGRDAFIAVHRLSCRLAELLRSMSSCIATHTHLLCGGRRAWRFGAAPLALSGGLAACDASMRQAIDTSMRQATH
jgi:hypothetical protein